MATDRLGPILKQMLVYAEAHLTTPVGRSVVMPGNSIVEDDCCEGQLHARIVSIVGVSGLSRQQMQPCLPLYQVRVGLGVTRCAHTVDDEGVPPTPDQMEGDAFQTFQDRSDLVEAIVCDIRGMPEVEGLLIEDWLPSGPGGGCVGGELTLTFKHILCTPCPEEAP